MTAVKIREIISNLWHRIQEPRALSAIYFFIYVVVAILGLAVVVDPPRSIQSSIGLTLLACWGWMLLVGGALGACTVLQGVWWLERAGAIACGFAMLIYGVAVCGIPVTQFSVRVASICFVLFAILAFAARLVKTRHYAYDPEK